MAEKLLKSKKKKVAPKKAIKGALKKTVLVGTYRADQFEKWPGFYNYPISKNDKIDVESAKKVNEIWLFNGAKDGRYFAAEFIGIKTRDELKKDYGYPATSKKAHGDAYLLFKISSTEVYNPASGLAENVIVRAKDFATAPKVSKALKTYLESPERNDPDLAKLVPSELTKLPREVLRVCEAAVQLMLFDDMMQEPVVSDAKKEPKAKSVRQKAKDRGVNGTNLCQSLASYCGSIERKFAQKDLFASVECNTEESDIRVVELFAGVGGFRVGLERASKHYKTVWNNQWEPSTKRQDASIVYQMQFGPVGHCNEDISTVNVGDIPTADLLVGGFPCQDYSVATTLKNSGGIEGKKGVLWWQIHRILRDKGDDAPRYLMLENVDRLLKSPASQRGRDFAIILASLSDLGYCVEWRVINAADYGMPQRRRRTYIVAYKNGTKLADEARKASGKPVEWIVDKGVEAKAFDCKAEESDLKEFVIEGNLAEVTTSFNKLGSKTSPFKEAGFMVDRHVYTMDVNPVYDGPCVTLGQIIVEEKDVAPEFFINDADMEDWRYLKGPKSEERTSVDEDGNEFTYHYSEGGMAFPDVLNKPSRTIITGEGGAGASRFKHVIQTTSGKFRRLIPLELERLNMFPDNHTKGASDIRRAFLMGNALVTGIVERIGLVLKERI